MGSMSAASAATSPSVPYHIPMQPQQQQGQRPDSPGANNMLPSYLTSPPHNVDSFAQAGSQQASNNSYQMYNSMNSNIHTPLGPDFSSVLSPEQHEGALNSQTSVNGFSSSSAGPLRNSAFNPFPTSSATSPSNSRPRYNTATLRDTSSSFAASSYPSVQQDIYISNPVALSQQTPSATASFDSVHHQNRYDFALGASQSGPSHVLSGQTKQPAFSAMDAYRLGLDPLAPTAQQMRQSGVLGSSAGAGGLGLMSRDPQASQLSSLHQQPPNMQAQLNGLSHTLSHQNAMQPQGPYGALSSANGPVQNNASVVNGAAHGSQQQQQQQQPQEEISTIFVVGFPDDMSEREFQNMFTFSAGFEAATLKIPNRELTSYGSAGLVSAASGRIGGLPMHGGSNDPYNLVTVNQGGVVVDGRDGTTSSWTAPPITPFMDESHFVQTTVQPPRKQIIGFAKFRTRLEALEARDVLQGRRVDLEKGSVLKAEMAKKNLHTKRGPAGVGIGGGPLGVGNSLLNGQTTSNIQSEALASGMNGLQGLNGSVAASDPYMQREKEISALGAMGIAGLGRRGTIVDERPDVGTIGMPGFGPRGARERAEEDERERERKRKEKEAARLRQNSSAFEAFHSVPQQMVRQGANSLLSAENGVIGNGTGEGRFPTLSSQSSMQSLGSQAEGPSVSPWGTLRDVGASAMSRKMTAGTIHRPSSTEPQDFLGREATSSPPSGAQSASEDTNPSAPFSPDSMISALPGPFSSFSHLQDDFQNPIGGASSVSASSASSVNGLQGLNEEDLSRAVGALAVSTSLQGTMSPQLPSPSSGTSSSTGRNPGDMNPPINTLYVGNLPASNSPGGSPSPYLEERLRDLFGRRLGYRKLCFRHKSNGPMCFVEFEDVAYATKALNELNGDNLGGLIRGGGIRLSYSKNPLGVRTPTSAGSGSGMLQQQQSLQTLFSTGDLDQFRPTRRDTASSGMTSPTTSYFYTNMSSPPPRFTSPPSFASSLSSPNMFPRAPPQGFGLTSSGGSSSSFSPFGISPTQSSIPDQPSAESSNDHFSRTLSPVHANVEASRAG